MSRKKNLRRLSVLVTAQTLYNLQKLADMTGSRNVGRVVDKLTREKMLAMKDSCHRPPEAIQNEPLTCEGCYWQTHGSFGQCFGCIREKTDNYRRPPETAP